MKELYDKGLLCQLEKDAPNRYWCLQILTWQEVEVQPYLYVEE